MAPELLLTADDFQKTRDERIGIGALLTDMHGISHARCEMLFLNPFCVRYIKIYQIFNVACGNFRSVHIDWVGTIRYGNGISHAEIW